jgi:hypothetical protein
VALKGRGEVAKAKGDVAESGGTGASLVVIMVGRQATRPYPNRLPCRYP